MARRLTLIDSDARQTARKSNPDATFSATSSDQNSQIKHSKHSKNIRKLRTIQQSFQQFHNSNIEVKYLQIPTIRHAKQRQQTRYTAQDNSTTIHATQMKATSRMNELSHRQFYQRAIRWFHHRRMSPDKQTVGLCGIIRLTRIPDQIRVDWFLYVRWWTYTRKNVRHRYSM